MWLVFHERSGSREESEEHEEGNEGKITRGTQENTQTNKNDHTCARSMNTKEIQDPKSTTDDTRGNRFFSVEEVLNPQGDLPMRVLNPRWIFSVEGPRSLSWSRSDMDEQSSISK